MTTLHEPPTDEPPAWLDEQPPPPVDLDTRRNGRHRPDNTTATPPHDRDAERAIIGSCLLDKQAIASSSEIITPADFYHPAHELIYDTITHLYARLHPVDPITVADELTRRGQLDRAGGHAALHEAALAVTSTASASYYAAIVARHALRRRLITAGTRITQLGHQAGDTDPADTITRAHDELTTVTARGIPGVEQNIPGAPLDQFLSADTDDEPAWLIPGFIERQDRLILTAAEGTGKSTLLRQWGIQAGAGIHPFTGHTFPPIKVLLLDLENSPRQTRRALRPLRLAAPHIDPQLVIIECRQEGLDLTTGTDRAWLDQLLTAHRPDLLITGPIYKMAGGNPNDEVDAKPAALAIDALRAKHDIAVILEAHTRKGESTNPRHRPKEPFGWSGWMRWPEFGIHLSKDGEITHWRGMRDATRDIPDALTRGGKWPWSPITSINESRFFHIKRVIEEAGELLSERDIADRTGMSQPMVHRVIADNPGPWQALRYWTDVNSSGSPQ